MTRLILWAYSLLAWVFWLGTDSIDIVSQNIPIAPTRTGTPDSPTAALLGQQRSSLVPAQRAYRRSPVIPLSRNFLFDRFSLDRCDPLAELCSLPFDELELLLAVPSLVILCSFVDVVLTILQHSIDQSSEPMSHRSDGFRGAELTTQAAVLRAEVGLASQ